MSQVKLSPSKAIIAVPIVNPSTQAPPLAERNKRRPRSPELRGVRGEVKKQNESGAEVDEELETLHLYYRKYS